MCVCVCLVFVCKCVRVLACEELIFRTGEQNAVCVLRNVNAIDVLVLYYHLRSSSVKAELDRPPKRHA